jgi:CysZ protein
VNSITSVLSACVRALRDLKEPRVIVVMALPVLASLALWFVVATWFWQGWVTVVGDAIGSTDMARWLRDWGVEWLVNWMGVMAVVALMIPALLITNMIITEIFAMPAIVNFVAGRDYPLLERRSGGSIAGGILNATLGIAIYLVFFVVSLPLWLLGPVGLVAGALNSAYLMQRLFCYDSLSEHAGTDEYRALVKRARGRLFLLGLALAPLYYVPFVNLFAPVLSGIAFTHYCLRELSDSRSATQSRVRSTPSP